jgi:ectoine hydroxylase-related dioxygenase (phytanoyl-CoA dioxygenase family)
MTTQQGAKTVLSKEQLESYRANGYLMVRGLIPNEMRLDTLMAIDGLLCVKQPHLRRSTRASVTEDVHAKILELADTDRHALARVYDAIRKVAPFWSMTGAPALVEASSQLLASESVGVIFRGNGIRLDLPNEDKWRSGWHQEYHSQMSSVRAVTAWFSLVPVTMDMGPVELLPRSHVEGLLPVRCLDPMNARKNYAGTFELRDVQGLPSKYPMAHHETEPGDVIFLDFLTVHQSGYNRAAGRARISCQVRYFDMLEAGSVANDWVGGWQEGGDFRQIHPDKVAV